MSVSIELSANNLVKSLVVLSLSAPLIWLGWLIGLEARAPGSGLGADPVEEVVHYLGEWALRVLLLAYAVSPLRRLSKSPVLGRSRRLIGLFAFAYVCLHILSYVAFYLEFEWRALLEDFVERAYITAGMAAFVCLVLLAGTSTRGWQRRLRRNWQKLHRLIYPAIVLALVHLWWLTKDGFAEVSLYTLIFACLSFERLYSSKALKTWLHGALLPHR